MDWNLRKAVRMQIQKDLQDGAVPEACLLRLDEVQQHLPMRMGGFSDFYTSLEHCQNVSRILRGFGEAIRCLPRTETVLGRNGRREDP